MFTEALHAGHMVGYFGLAAQFRTQDEPAYCGLSTLVMVLNTLEVGSMFVLSCASLDGYHWILSSVDGCQWILSNY